MLLKISYTKGLSSRANSNTSKFFQKRLENFLTSYLDLGRTNEYSTTNFSPKNL